MTARTHHVKSWTEFYAAINGGQPFDIRNNDRKYKIGDTIVFKEWDTDKGRFTGNECQREITHLIQGGGTGSIAPLHGLARNYVVLGFAPVF